VMTINTTQVAIDAAQLALAWLHGRAPSSQSTAMRTRLADTLRVMVGFFAGVVLGAVAYRRLGFVSLAPVIAILLALAAAARGRGPT
jgi:uncharacterized membrane protein YoaK (UPF0700 family)